jgi:hypothetical protein
LLQRAWLPPALQRQRLTVTPILRRRRQQYLYGSHVLSCFFFQLLQSPSLFLSPYTLVQKLASHCSIALAASIKCNHLLECLFSASKA